jgi:hypothetical protein
MMTPERRLQACIDLRIPKSGSDELDALIREARQYEFAVQLYMTHTSKMSPGFSVRRAAYEARTVPDILTGKTQDEVREFLRTFEP